MWRCQLFSVFCVFTWFDGGFIYICRYGGSVVPAMPSASGIRVFTMKLRGLLHQSAKSCCQVARSCFKGILRAHRHSLFSFTIQMLVQSVLLKYWFAETARYQNGQGSTASCAFVNFLNIDRAEQLRRCFPQYPKMCIPGSQRPGATVWTQAHQVVRSSFTVFQAHCSEQQCCLEMVWHNVESPFKGDVCC